MVVHLDIVGVAKVHVYAAKPQHCHANLNIVTLNLSFDQMNRNRWNARLKAYESCDICLARRINLSHETNKIVSEAKKNHLMR